MIWRLFWRTANLCLVQRPSSDSCDAQRQFGINVKRIRQDRALTQEQLAERAQLQPSYISAVERGIRNITICNIERIAKALDVTIAELVS